MPRILRFITEECHKACLMDVNMCCILPEYNAGKSQIKGVVFFSHFRDPIDVWWFQVGKPATAGDMLDEIRARLRGESNIVGRRFSVTSFEVGADYGIKFLIKVI